MDKNTKTKSSMGIRILVLMCIAMVGLIVATSCGMVLSGMSKKAVIEWQIVLQDVLVFIVPAIVASYIFCSRPWHNMALDRRPTGMALLIVLLVSFVSMPALNWIIDWNQHMHLPDSMKAVEAAMRSAEDVAQGITDMLMADMSLFTMLEMVLLVGVLAGLSEEIFFRGGMLRMMKNNGNSHIAVWTVAIVFSAIHMQFFGFFPRLLLGAWLGYLLVWTKSLWVPIIAHALNNSLVVFSKYLEGANVIDKGSLETLGVPDGGGFPLMAVVSAIVTIALIYAARPWLTSAKR